MRVGAIIGGAAPSDGWLADVMGPPGADQCPFVLAPSFHGATLLALLLSNHPDVVDTGDTNPPNPPGPLTSCSCGLTMADCPFWAVVVEGVSRYLTPFKNASRRLLPTVPDVTANHTLNVRLTAAVSLAGLSSSAAVWRPFHRRLDEYVHAWIAYRQSALRASGATLLVDGEKSVTKFLAFRSIAGAQVRMIHLTRDPRGFANSVNRHRLERGHPEESVSAITGTWVKGHEHILRAGRGLSEHQYLHVRYEDLAARPRETMTRIFGFLGVEDIDVCRPPDKAHVFGNGMAYGFSGVVKLDVAWQEALSTGEQTHVSRLAEPLFSRFGYRL